MNSRISLNALSVFCVAAEQLSFKHAAIKLNISASAVSHQIRNLENLLNYPLFVRMDKQLQLSHEGLLLYSEIKAPLAALKKASERALANSTKDRLTLSVAPVFATKWLMPRLKNFYKSYPNYLLNIIATPDYATVGVDDFDAAIRLGKSTTSLGEATHLLNVEFIAVAHPRVVEENALPLDIPQVLSYPKVVNTLIPDLWERWAGIHSGMALGAQQLPIQVQGAAQVVEAIQALDCVALVELRFARDDLESGRLVQISNHVLQAEETYFLTTTPSFAKSENYKCFNTWLQSEVVSE
jgi:LysR family glycine cleavage system transcriptional activator